MGRPKKSASDTSIAPWRPLLDSEFEAILERVARCGDTVASAARLVLGEGRPINTVYARISNDADCLRRYEEARAQWCGLLYSEAARRAVHGVSKPVFYKGETVGHVTEHSDSLLTLLLINADKQLVSKRTQAEVINHAPDDGARWIAKFSFEDCEKLPLEMRRQLLAITRYLQADGGDVPMIEQAPRDDTFAMLPADDAVMAREILQ